MAERPIFIPQTKEGIGVEERLFTFQWHAGLAKSQKQKSIADLHEAAARSGIHPVLEISSKSTNQLGVELSAFNLSTTTKLRALSFTVETAYQGSKVFERGGPYKDLLGMDSRAAKKDIRLRESGNLVGFEFFGMRFPLVPRTYFYDWLYINVLINNTHLLDELAMFRGFSDIEFNPTRAINCQAYSAALYLSLSAHDRLEEALRGPEAFLAVTAKQYSLQKRNIAVQGVIL